MPKIEVKVDHNFHLIGNEKLLRWEESRGNAYKLYREAWYNWPLTFTLGRVPIHLDIEATSNCNLLCTMCPRTTMLEHGSFWKVENFEFEKFKEIIDEGTAKGLSSLKLQYLGEPLMNPKIFDMVRYAKDKGVIDVMFNTNATNLTERKAKKILESGLDKLFFSFDSPRKSEYEAIRVNANFAKTLKNISNFMKLRDELKMKTPFTRVSMVKLGKEDELWDEFEELFGEVVDGLAQLDYMEQPKLEVQIGIADQLSESTILKNRNRYLKNPVKVEDPARESNIQAGSGTDTNKDNDDGSSRVFCCPQLWQRMFVHPDGVVTPCCTDHKRELVMGNINDSSIEEIWHNEKYTYMREMHKNGYSNKIPSCRTCPLALN